MPWSASDAKGKTAKANTPDKAKKWAEIANAAVANMNEEENGTLHGRIQEATTQQSGAVEIVVDGDTTTLKNVLLLGRTSRNRADYSDASLRNAVHQFEDADVFVGHSRDGSNPLFDRSMGVTRNPEVMSDGIHGDHSFPTKHRMAEDLVWRAKHAPRRLGYSIDADNTWTLKNGRRQVSSIDKLFSVDLVTRPATSGGLREDELPPDQTDFAEYAFSALSDCRSIILSESPLAEKRSRLMEAIGTLHGEMLEGEIGDATAQSKPIRDMREMLSIARQKLDDAMWNHSDFPKPHDKIKRQAEVLKDHLKTLSAVQCNCPDCAGKSSNAKEELNMEWKELTLDGIKANRPDLLGLDEKTRMTEEVKTLKAANEQLAAEVKALKDAERTRVQEEQRGKEIAAELTAAKFPTADAKAFSARFQEQLKAAPDKATRGEIIKDRMTLLSGRVQEATMPSPLAKIDGDNDVKPAPSRLDKFFVG